MTPICDIIQGELIYHSKIQGGVSHYRVYSYDNKYYLIYNDEELLYKGGKEDTIRELYKATFASRYGLIGQSLEDVYGPEEYTKQYEAKKPFWSYLFAIWFIISIFYFIYCLYG